MEDERWRRSRFKISSATFLIVYLLCRSVDLSYSLNDEGLSPLRFRDGVRDPYGGLLNWRPNEGEEDPCWWKGVECSQRRVVNLNIVQSRDAAYRRLLQLKISSVSNSKKTISKNNEPQSKHDLSPALPPLSPSPLNSPSPLPASPSASPTSRFFLPSSPTPTKPPILGAPVPSPSVSLAPSQGTNSFWTDSTLIIIGAVGAVAIISILLACVLLLRGTKAVIVNPWATGISGQLQKAFVTGVPKLKRSELETACEDFSNVVSSSSEDTVYKGTLSSGVEIAVTSTTITSSKDWSKNLEEAFRKKIDTLSKVNHKNFVNLLGYCKEQKPFTRMMIFEYAPNGTLFEHLHIQESEHLDWGTRLRIVMGIAYCLEHMHQLSPPVVQKKLHSSTIYLTEDYAAKISDFGFWNEATMLKMRSAGMDDTPTTFPESNIYNFGVILLEMITGRLSNSLDDGPLVDWASDFLTRKKFVKDMVDPTLASFKEEELEKLCEVIAYCIHPDPNHRPTMKEVTARLREITLMTPERATPRASPLWWAELEIISTEGS